MCVVMKEIGVKMTIKGQEVPVKSPVRSKIDKEGNLVLTFTISQGEVKMTFDKRDYLDITDE